MVFSYFTLTPLPLSSIGILITTRGQTRAPCACSKTVNLIDPNHTTQQTQFGSRNCACMEMNCTCLGPRHFFPAHTINVAYLSQQQQVQLPFPTNALGIMSRTRVNYYLSLIFIERIQFIVGGGCNFCPNDIFVILNINTPNREI